MFDTSKEHFMQLICLHPTIMQIRDAIQGGLDRNRDISRISAEVRNCISKLECTPGEILPSDLAPENQELNDAILNAIADGFYKTDVASLIKLTWSSCGISFKTESQEGTKTVIHKTEPPKPNYTSRIPATLLRLYTNQFWEGYEAGRERIIMEPPYPAMTRAQTHWRFGYSRGHRLPHIANGEWIEYLKIRGYL